MEQNIEEVIDIAKSMINQGRNFEDFCVQRDGRLKESLEQWRHSMASEVKKLSILRRDLSKKRGANIEDNEYDGNGPDDDNSEDEEKVFSIPELKFVSWLEANSRELPLGEYVTLQVPSSQPAPDDLSIFMDQERSTPSVPMGMPPMGAPSMVGPPVWTPSAPVRKYQFPTVAVDKARPFKRTGLSKDSQPLEELPDSLRVCSQRLKTFLNFNIHSPARNQNTYYGTPIIFLRPFKSLVYKGEDIRKSLTTLERIRRERFPSHSEEEHDEQWKTLRPEDNLQAQVIDPDTLEPAQLTALIKDLRCLTHFMDGYIEPTMTIGQLSDVYFTDLWFVFPARSLIYVKDKKVPHKIWKVIQRAGGQRDRMDRPSPPTGVAKRPKGRIISQLQGFGPFVIDCFHLDYDGTRYVHTYQQIKIDYYEGLQPLTSLPAMPIRTAEIAELVDREGLMGRGKQFVKYTRPSYRQYAGRNQILRPNGARLHEYDADIPDNATRYAEWIESEVMVDFEKALQEMPSWQPGMNELDLYKLGEVAPSVFDIGRDLENEISLHVFHEERDKCHRWNKERTHPTIEEDLLLLPDRVFAFAFRIRKWACLQIGKDHTGEEMLKEKIPRLDPWNDLQLPSGHKRLVQSLIESHSAAKGPHGLQFDLVRAKGKGITILLHGVPGVGKTSTAECAAEAYNRPLLPITCGDLGLAPREVEEKLEEAFQLAQLWDCVLLLDEADIFLAQRSQNDIKRNALVSVFLRVLEYYQGILFLTTNRVGVFDEAFKSRIHLPLYYPPLNWKFAEKIWRTNLGKLTSTDLVSVDVDDILSYAEDLFERQDAKASRIGPVWNGRQIRNAFQSAVALASYGLADSRAVGTKVKLEREHFERVSKVSNEFNNYIWSIKTQSDSEKAERWGFRSDAYHPDESIHLKPVNPEASTGATALTFGSRLPNIGLAGLPLQNNPFQNVPQWQGAFPANMAGDGPGMHFSQPPQGQLHQQLQQHQANPQLQQQQVNSQVLQQQLLQLQQQQLQLQQQQQQIGLSNFPNSFGTLMPEVSAALQPQLPINSGTQGPSGQ